MQLELASFILLTLLNQRLKCFSNVAGIAVSWLLALWLVGTVIYSPYMATAIARSNRSSVAVVRLVFVTLCLVGIVIYSPYMATAIARSNLSSVAVVWLVFVTLCLLGSVIYSPYMAIAITRPNHSSVAVE